ncbi:sugar lactone lactonase YvrE [Azospirillum lipoferum]|uniref:SMP-30/gluconolactonase/LRE family protein n=1 Tax=Azospirillum lipoferum TaxID=193 RepID=A0A5A9G2X6_AZOLI|nr:MULTISPECIES: SMP-30/gluconolactonase/LRE family protein [Azospirillum]KAA0588963.1 SMP-30/gluconolactonase/LRE family protein [Azospirillum lipoferum]MCP1615153.1 sugar lactone lactonase YvrE [Azospirillum lipoferum]MDW5537054.1 SMP-30/gluconolactonase/LRE family protein [Azospirillum sp. NL1]
MAQEARCVWQARALLGEGPLWSPRQNAVYFVDIRGSRILRHGLSDGSQSGWQLDDAACWLVESADGDGFIAGLRSRRVVRLRLEPGQVTVAEEIARIEPDGFGNRLNDGKADARGRLWIGSMDDAEEAPTGSFYRIDADGTVARVDQGYTVANGPALSPDGRTIYHTDSAARTVYAFDIGADGSLSGKRVHIRFTEADGYPDGMTCDAEGGLWVAHWDGARVSRFRPDGTLDRVIALPVSRVTSCVFAGPDLDRLFITTAAHGRGEEPLAGSLFECDPGVRGLPPCEFGNLSR